MFCEIINPSDPYTLETDNFVAAGLGILLIGGGQLGLISQDKKHETPVLAGWEEWRSENDVPDDGSYLDNPINVLSLAKAMDSVRYGNYQNREQFASKAKSKEALSSMNDIGSAAWDFAAKVLKHYYRLTGKTEKVCETSCSIP